MKKAWRRKEVRYKVILSTFMVCIILGLGFAISDDQRIIDGHLFDWSNVVYAESNDSVYNEELTMKVNYGLDHYAKYGRYMNVKATIQNTGDDLDGWLQVILPKQKDSVIYRQKAYIPSGETKEVRLVIPVVDDTGLLKVSLLNEKQDIILKDSYKVKIGNYDQQAYIGILSDDMEALSYFDTLATKVFALDNTTMPTNYKELDLLDIIVINQFNTEVLSKEQIDALDKWIINGGTLVVGTGEYADETLSQLKELYAIEYNGQSIDDTLTFGLNNKSIKELKQAIKQYADDKNLMQEIIKNRNDMIKTYNRPLIDINADMPKGWSDDVTKNLSIVSMNKKIADVTLDNGTTLIKENDYQLMQIKNYGHGNVQLFSFDLGLKKELKTIGVSILVTVTKNLNLMKQTELEEEYYGSNDSYGIINSVSYVDTDNIPKVLPYIVVIVIYIILVGPCTFIILKKIDKRSLTWIVIPILTVVFTFVIYAMGSKTRINDPYVGYVELLRFREDNTATDEVYFALTAPYNYKYNVELDNQYNITELNNGSYDYDRFDIIEEEDSYLDNYVSAINMGVDTTILEVNNTPAFTPVYYQSERTYQANNKLISDIHYTGEDVSGTIQNNYSFDIINACLLSDGYLTYLGTINKGQTIQVDEKEKFFYTTQDELYNFNFTNKFVEKNGTLTDITPDMNRKSNLLYQLIEKSLIEGSYENYIIGFIDDSHSTIRSVVNNQNNIIEDLSKDVSAYGIRAILMPVQVDHTKDNLVLVPSIDSYIKKSDSYYGSQETIHYIDTESVTKEYQFPEQDKIVSLNYLQNRNKEISTDYLRSFDGNIYMLNINTGEYDEVLQGGIGSSISDLSNYLTMQNSITIRYTVDTMRQSYRMLLPSISYWKEAK